MNGIKVNWWAGCFVVGALLHCYYVGLFNGSRLFGSAPFPSAAGSARISVMLARLRTFTLLGIDALPVEVEVDLSPAALPKTTLVGLPEAAVKESTHRVERAIANSGFTRPQDRVVINLAPGDLPKQAPSFDLPVPSFDLPVALGVLAGSGQFSSDVLEQSAVVGELALEIAATC